MRMQMKTSSDKCKCTPFNLEVFFSCGRSFSQWKIDSHIFCHDNDDNFVHTFLNFTKISTFEAVFSTDTLLFTPKVELLFSHALRKYENVVLEKYLSPPPELSKSAERSECSFSMRMKSNSAPKQILVTTSPELSKWESCPVTLKSFLDTLWWRWVKASCYKMFSMYVGGLISRFQWVSVSFQWGGALQRFCTRSRGVAKLVSPSETNPKQIWWWGELACLRKLTDLQNSTKTRKWKICVWIAFLAPKPAHSVNHFNCAIFNFYEKV